MTLISLVEGALELKHLAAVSAEEVPWMDMSTGD